MLAVMQFKTPKFRCIWIWADLFVASRLQDETANHYKRVKILELPHPPSLHKIILLIRILSGVCVPPSPIIKF